MEQQEVKKEDNSNQELKEHLEKPELPKKPMISPLQMFFALGDKVTKGDPQRKADYDYYMLWIIFGAFFGVFFGNLRNFIITHEFQFLGWALFGFAIMWFQYFNLKMSWQMRALQKKARKEGISNEEETKIESVDDMLKDFKKDKEDKREEPKKDANDGNSIQGIGGEYKTDTEGKPRDTSE